MQTADKQGSNYNCGSNADEHTTIFVMLFKQFETHFSLLLNLHMKLIKQKATITVTRGMMMCFSSLIQCFISNFHLKTGRAVL